MKKIVIISFFVCFIYHLYAQKAVPDFTVKDIYGHTHNLYSDYLDKDQHVFIEFFNTGCIPCQELTPKVNTVFKEFGCNYGRIVFLGVEIYDNDADVIKFVNEFDMSFPATSGEEGGGFEVYTSYGYSYTPYKIIISPDYYIVSDNLPVTQVSDLRNSLLKMGFEMQTCEGNDFIFYSLLSDNDSVVGIIDYENYTINLQLPDDTDLSNLKSTFVNAVNSTVEVDGVEQISGISTLDFSNGPIVYDLTSEHGVIQNWTVSVQTISTINFWENIIELYPNPSDGIFVLNLKNLNYNKGEIIITDITGKQVYSSIISNDIVNINLSKETTGIYLLNIFTDKNLIIKKVSIN